MTRPTEAPLFVRLVAFVFGRAFPIFFTRVFPLLFIGMSVFILVMGLKERRLGQESLSWPAVSGTVTRSQVERRTETDSDGHTDVDYKPTVRFTYSVEGVEYQGMRLQFGAPDYDKNSEAQAQLDPFPVGKEVPVYYNPENPKLAVLLTGAGQGAALLIGLCVVFIAIGVGLFFTLPILMKKFFETRATNLSSGHSGESDWEFGPDRDDD